MVSDTDRAQPLCKLNCEFQQCIDLTCKKFFQQRLHMLARKLQYLDAGFLANFWIILQLLDCFTIIYLLPCEFHS